MRRKFKDQMQQKTYDSYMETRPTSVATGLGQAFFFGYDNPDLKATGPRVGLDCRRADNKAVLYVYKCGECGHSGDVRLPGDKHEGETSACEACGTAVTLEWDGGVTLKVGQQQWIEKEKS